MKPEKHKIKIITLGICILALSAIAIFRVADQSINQKIMTEEIKESHR